MKIKLIGVGGYCGNTVNSICRMDIENVDFAVMDNGAKAFGQAVTATKLQMI